MFHRQGLGGKLEANLEEFEVGRGRARVQGAGGLICVVTFECVWAELAVGAAPSPRVLSSSRPVLCCPFMVCRTRARWWPP